MSGWVYCDAAGAAVNAGKVAMVRAEGAYLEIELEGCGTRYVKKTLATLEEVRDKLGMGDCPWLADEIVGMKAARKAEAIRTVCDYMEGVGGRAEG